LGIKIEKYENGKVYLSQPCLIEKFLKASGMIDYNPNTTPSAVEPLGLGNDVEGMNESWEYTSIIGI